MHVSLPRSYYVARYELHISLIPRKYNHFPAILVNAPIALTVAQTPQRDFTYLKICIIYLQTHTHLRFFLQELYRFASLLENGIVWF